MDNHPADPLAELRRANAELAAARKAALNMMEEAVLARDALRASEERQTFLLKLSDALRPLDGPEEIKTAAARVLGEHLRVNRALYAEVEGDNWIVTRGYEQGVASLPDGPYPAATYGHWVMRTYRDGRRIVFRDTRTDPRFATAERDAHAAVGILAAVGVPLVKGGRLVAILAVHTAGPRDWTGAEIGLVEEVAERTWAAVERAKAEAELKASEERYRLLVESQADMICRFRPEGTILFVNDAYARAFGTTAAKLVGTQFWDLIPPEQHDGVQAQLDGLTPESPQVQIENMIVSARGPRWSLWTNRALEFDAAGRVVVAQSTGMDITDRKNAEAALKASEERLRLIVESATDYAIVTLDPDRTVTTWSPGAEAVFGWTGAEMVGRSADVVFTPEDRAAGAPQQDADTARQTGRAADERWHLRKDGRRFFASGVLTPLGEGDRGFVKVARDLTDRKRAEEELEERVAARTAELAAAVDALEAEIDRRRDLARRLSTAQEDERRRVARDLHDTLGQLQAGLGLALAAARHTPDLPAAAGERLDEVKRLADELGREVHALAVRLRPTSLDDLGLEPALRQLVADWFARTGVGVEFDATGVRHGRLPPEVETAVYRVVQEALTNVAKHAGATA
ncbi:MAG: PAS domain S-box protein, partial [Gemmataceae bacterium]